MAFVAVIMEYSFKGAVNMLEEALHTNANTYSSKLGSNLNFEIAAKSWKEIGAAFDKSLKERKSERGFALLDEEGKVAYEKAFGELKLENEALLSDVEDVNVRRTEFMAQDAELELVKFSLDSLPKLKTEGQNGAWLVSIMDALDPLITE